MLPGLQQHDMVAAVASTAAYVVAQLQQLHRDGLQQRMHAVMQLLPKGLYAHTVQAAALCTGLGARLVQWVAHAATVAYM